MFSIQLPLFARGLCHCCQMEGALALPVGSATNSSAVTS